MGSDNLQLQDIGVDIEPLPTAKQLQQALLREVATLLDQCEAYAANDASLQHRIDVVRALTERVQECL